MNSLQAFVLVSVTAAVISLVCWWPLSLPGQFVLAMIPQAGSAGVELLRLISPVLVLVVLFIFRKALVALLVRALNKVPAQYRFLTPSVVATACFTLVWSPIHVAGDVGLLPNIFFPAVIGLYTFLISSYGAHIQTALSSLFEAREKIPKFLRYMVAAAIPFLIGYLIMSNNNLVQQLATKQQLVVLLSMCCAYLVVAPSVQSARRTVAPA